MDLVCPRLTLNSLCVTKKNLELNDSPASTSKDRKHPQTPAPQFSEVLADGKAFKVESKHSAHGDTFSGPGRRV